MAAVDERAGYRTQVESSGQLTILDLPDDDGALVCEWARAAGVSLGSIASARNSLERIFLDAIEDTSNARS
jgi:hypothetical protein